MQRIVYCAAMLLLAAVMDSCAQREPLKLYSAKDSEQPVPMPLQPEHAFTLILAGNDEIYYYSGDFKKDKKTEKTGFGGIRGILKEKKKAIGDSLVVLIKPSGGASYKNTVDILDEMIINDIKKYALIDITQEEEQALGLKPFMSQEKTVAPPPVVTTKPINYDEKDILLIRLDGKGAIEYGFGKGLHQPLTKLNDNDTARFSNIIKGLVDGKSGYEIFIKGDNDAKYPAFKLIIEALKANELFKFKMITGKD